jgi:hypothetical protein
MITGTLRSKTDISESRNPPRDNGDLVHRVGMLDRLGHNRMPGLMKGDDFFLPKAPLPVKTIFEV